MSDSKPNDFNLGDFVYHESGEIGQITDITDNGNLHYRISYCQFKDIDRGTCGGNRPIFKEGYPKKVTNCNDILFVEGVKLLGKIKETEKELLDLKVKFNAIKTTRNTIYGERK
jgi:hypothetical protein